MLTVILANGRFPSHPVPMSELKSAKQIVCCDGAVVQLLERGYKPSAIVGDLDSLPDEYRHRYQELLFQDNDQNTNDLTKAVHWCLRRGINEISILAGTGLREDHTLGNIGLLQYYQRLGLKVRMLTDYGYFTPFEKSSKVESFEGQQVSIFCYNCNTMVTTRNLRYPITKGTLNEPWMGTLNLSLGDWFELTFDTGQITVFQSYREY